MSVNISGVDKVELLRALWDNSKPARFFSSNGVNPPQGFDNKRAEEVVLIGLIDYFQGRCIKCDLSGNRVDPFLYDRDFGEGKFQEIVNNLRNKKYK